MAKKNVKNANVNTTADVIVKEDTIMANEVITSTEAIANIEEVDTMATEITTKEMILFTASRGKNTKLAWNEVTVSENDATTKVTGVAAELPIQAAEIIGNDKFVAWIDKDTAAKFIEDSKPVRGMASTLSDVFNRYCKVTDTTGAEKVALMLIVFNSVLEAIEAGDTEGAWVRPEEVKEEVPAEVEVDTEDITDAA